MLKTKKTPPQSNILSKLIGGENMCGSRGESGGSDLPPPCKIKTLLNIHCKLSKIGYGSPMANTIIPLIP